MKYTVSGGCPPDIINLNSVAHIGKAVIGEVGFNPWKLVWLAVAKGALQLFILGRSKRPINPVCKVGLTVMGELDYELESNNN